MSVVIVGGNERMVCQYMDICKNHGCKAKVYVKENGSLKKEARHAGLPFAFHQHGLAQNDAERFQGSEKE